ncbi:2'-5' RNA ligase family protein [Streptomyces sp. PTM05]|uniref:2'-5' RNA ligase family protein n=2 Tax=Streptantibioticus parmotrematis TaxID=2873249 RepID=A0ABS7R453_9ACTN|nr:2'-5' RNA ligase family protein [Streptantibioticus parmotrematis]
MADHWWWRPGWRQGRSFYTFHLTFQHATQVHRIAAAYRRALAAVPGLDLVPDQWLHLTMQGLGFTDEVSDTDLNAIIAAARERLRAVPAFDLTLTRPEITPEAIRWEAQPATPTIAVRDALRQAIGAVWPTVPEVADGFAPHVSIAYSNAAGPAGPIADALDQVHEPPAVTPIDRVDLIVLNRDTRMYQWTTHTSIPLR